MVEYKTIISANIPVSLAARLKSKTKGTRSRVIQRALTAYLDEQEAFSIEDIDTVDLLMELYYRNNVTPSQKSFLIEMWKELRE